jgi:hypothetical protein
MGRQRTITTTKGRLVGGEIATQAAVVPTADSCKEVDGE